MQIRIDVHDLPGRHSSKHRDIHVGVQRRSPTDILEPVPADAETASWSFEVTVLDGDDLRGPCVQGRPGERFVYLSWGTFDSGEFVMFGRSKLLLGAVPPDTLHAAVSSGTLVGSLGLMDDRGKLRMAAIRPPAIEWSAG